MQSSHLLDIMSAVAGATSQKQLPPLKAAFPYINAISFMYGTSKELVQTLVQMDKSPTLRYNTWPVIMLFLDLNYRDTDKPGAYTETVLQMAIVMPTLATYKADERYANIVEPILYPLWHELIKQIEESGCFSTQSENRIPYQKIDRLFWSKDGNTLNAIVDAIEIKDLKLNIIPNAKPRIINPDQTIHSDVFNLDIYA